MRPHSADEARHAVCDAVARWQGVFGSVLGRRLAFAADEYYLLAGRDFPPAAAYDGFAQHENGIGMVRAFEQAFDGHAGAPGGVRHGFFAWVDGAPARLPGAPARPGGHAGARAPAADRSPWSPATTGPGSSGPWSPGTSGATSRSSPSKPVFGGRRGGRPAHRGRPGPRPQRARRSPPFLGSRRLPLGGPVPRRADPRGPAPPRRGGAVTVPRWGRPGRPASQPGMAPGAQVDGPNRRRPAAVWSSPGDPTWASLRWSTASSDAGRRWSKRRPGSPGTGTAWRPSGTGYPFDLVDTGGWLPGGDTLDAKVSEQSERAVADADLVLVVTDVTVGVTDEDLAAAKVIRRAVPRSSWS